MNFPLPSHPIRIPLASQAQDVGPTGGSARIGIGRVGYLMLALPSSNDAHGIAFPPGDAVKRLGCCSPFTLPIATLVVKSSTTCQAKPGRAACARMKHRILALEALTITALHPHRCNGMNTCESCAVCGDRGDDWLSRVGVAVVVVVIFSSRGVTQMRRDMRRDQMKMDTQHRGFQLLPYLLTSLAAALSASRCIGRCFMR